MRGSPFLAATISTLVIVFNISKLSIKSILLGSLAIGIVGNLLLVLSQSISMAVLGIFLAGFNGNGVCRLTISFISEITDRQLGAKFMSVLLIGLAIGGIVVSSVYGVVPHWRAMSTYFLVFPNMLLFVWMLLLLEDTPQSMLRNMGIEEVCLALNRIGWINSGEEDLIDEEEVELYMEDQQAMEAIQKPVSPMDLCAYPSQRRISLPYFAFSLLVDIIFFGFYVLINVIGFNPALNSTMLVFSQLVAFPFLICLAATVPRKISSIIIFAGSAIICLILFFLEVPPHCK